MRWHIYIFILFFFAIPIGGIQHSQVEPIVNQMLQTEKQVEVIVTYKEPNDQIKIPEYLISTTRNEIELEKNLPIINGFSGKVSEKGLQSLINNPNVEGIYYNYPVYANLQRSRSTINATIVNSLRTSGSNITGKDQTICILDTGVNYTHQDLGGCNVTDVSTGICSKVIGGYDYVNNDGDPMDDEGHGTHVSGIAASSGNITGIAPDAKIVSIKVLDDTGSGSSADVISGIQWCVNNATKFNISIISMSLGTSSPTLFSSHCDDTDPATARAVNNATTNNITVIASSGNDNSQTKIARPACLSNVTSVGAIDRTDSIASYSNRNSITDLLAPGGSNTAATHINSTSISGGYAGLSGTSQSVPHVSGAIALLNQYKKQESNTTLTPKELTDALRNNGKNITENGVNYTRINIDKTLIFLDTKNPGVNVNISNSSIEIDTINITVNWTATDIHLQTTSINVTYPNGSLLVDDNTNLTLTTTRLNIAGDYTVNVYSNDSKGNTNLTTKIITVSNSNIPIVTLRSPIDGLNTSTNSINFNCSATDDENLQNITLYHNLNTTFSINQTAAMTGTSNNSNFTLTNIPDGSYNWNCEAYDNESLSDVGDKNFTFRIDTVNPGLKILSPSNSTSSSTSSVTFTYNVTDTGINNCTLNIDNSVDQTNTTITPGIVQSFMKSFSNGDFTWNLACTDYANNKNTTETRDLTVSVSSDTGNGNSGGSTGGSTGSSPNIVTENPKTVSVIQEVSYPKLEVSSKDLIDLNPPLQKTLEKIFGTTSNIRTLNQSSTTRKLETTSTESTITTIIQYTGEESINNFLVYDEIPKKFAASTKDITINASGADITIIENDPILLFAYPSLDPGASNQISYKVNKEVDINLEKYFNQPILLVKESEDLIIEKTEQDNSLTTHATFKASLKSYLSGYWWTLPILAMILIPLSYYSYLLIYMGRRHDK